MERLAYALKISYDGGAYRGFQHQPGLPTVSDVLFRALREAGISVPFFAASRTDAGVHALGQVVSFRARAELSPVELARTLNELLPRDIRVVQAARAHRSFHAQFSALGKTYRYFLWEGPEGEGSSHSWALPDSRAFPSAGPGPLDAGALEAALSSFLGTRDFRGLAAGSARPGLRTLRRVEVACEPLGPARRITLTVDGDRFAKYMVRTLVGLSVGRAAGHFSNDELRRARQGELLPGRLRAPARGLVLWRVHYPEALDPFRSPL